MSENNQLPLLPLDYETPPDRPRRASLLFWLLVCASPLLALAILSPFFTSIGKSPAAAYRVKSMANLRAIGQAISMYSDDHQGQYPDSFETILLNEDVTSGIFVNPSSHDIPATGPTSQAVASQLSTGGHLSYVYLGRGLTAKTVTPDTVLAYELIQYPSGGSNMLFGDGHVDYIDGARATAFIAHATTAPVPVTMPSP
jgi:prepilin-type processing-associated H-X9-DG protein